MTLPHLHAVRYVQPLREGGSLPAIVDTESGLFVVKFRGAGQGPKALVAELIVGLVAQTIGLATPELALVELGESFGRSEPDPEIQDLLRASHGVNIGLRFLEGAFNFAPSAADDFITPEFAAGVVWLDAFLTNPDRTHHNPNLLIWNRQPWLIDHGAALYAHHNWGAVDEARTRTHFPLISQHVLLAGSGDLAATDARAAEALSTDILAEVLRQIPDDLLMEGEGEGDVESARARYLAYLTARLESPRAWVAEAEAARERVRLSPPRPLRARR